MKFLTTLLWPPVEDGNFLDTAQKRCIIVFCTLASVVGLASSIASLPDSYPEYPVFSLVEVFGSPLYMLGPILIYLGYDFRRVATGMLVFAYLFIAGPAAAVGGMISDDAIFLVPWVMVTTLVLGSRAGLASAAIAVVTYIGLFLGRSEIAATPIKFTRDELSLWLLSTLGFAAALTGIGAAIFQQEMQKMTENLRAARMSAESADRAKSEFLANMSHEIRTPMNGVMGMAELLATTNLDGRQKMMTDVIVKSGSTLLAMINDILDFSKITAGKMELDPEPFCLADIVEDIAALLSAKAFQKDIELSVRIDPNLPESFVGDAARIRQVLTNLVGNAIKFTESGAIEILVGGRLSPASGLNAFRLRFEVRDTGIGIPPEKLGAIFDKFSQVDNSSTRRHQGTGLGLAISSALVELMNGTINVESELGKGSTFWFEITIPAQKENLPDDEAFDISGARVLCVGGDEISQSLLQQQLQRWHLDLAVAGSGREALAIIRIAAQRDVAVDCLVLDGSIKDMDCADFISVLRADRQFRSTPIIMLSALDRSDMLSDAANFSVDAKLVKPYRSSLLRDTILRVLNERSAAERDNIAYYSEPDIRLVKTAS